MKNLIIPLIVTLLPLLALGSQPTIELEERNYNIETSAVSLHVSYPWAQKCDPAVAQTINYNVLIHLKTRMMYFENYSPQWLCTKNFTSLFSIIHRAYPPFELRREDHDGHSYGFYYHWSATRNRQFISLILSAESGGSGDNSLLLNKTLTVDLTNGQEVNILKLVKDKPKLLQLIYDKLCASDPKYSQSDLSYMSIPENIALYPNEMVFIYNRYELTNGTVTVKIPYDELTELIDLRRLPHSNIVWMGANKPSWEHMAN